MKRIRIKICCIANEEEARMAIAAGADAIGLVGPMPSGPGPIPLSDIARIVPSIPPGVSSFLLTSEIDAQSIIDQYNLCHTQVIQLTDYLRPNAYPALRKALPHVKLVQVIHVDNESDIDQAIHLSWNVDGLLLDSGSPLASTKLLGGTGKVHDWEISRRIVESVNKPVFLAGGLTAENVVEGIQTVKPFGVDLCSGIRTNGSLDLEKLHDFVQAVRSTEAK